MRRGAALVSISLIAILSLFPTRTLARNDLESTLRQTFKKKLLLLRTPFVSTLLKFDQNGNLLGTSETGPWTTNGILQVNNLWLEKQQLKIAGERVILVLGLEKDRLVPVVSDRPVHITVDLSGSPIGQPQLSEILFKVFAAERLEERFDTYWKPLVDLDQPLEDIKNSRPEGTVGVLSGQRLVYYVARPTVTPPTPLRTPEPQYSEEARQGRVQGKSDVIMIINEEGAPEIIKLSQALYRSLDINALLALSEWKFRPGMRKGIPVPVIIHVQIRFSLY